MNLRKRRNYQLRYVALSRRELDGTVVAYEWVQSSRDKSLVTCSRNGCIPPSLVWCKRARVVDVCNPATNERMRPRVCGPTVPRSTLPLSWRNQVYLVVAHRETSTSSWQASHVISFRNVEHVPAPVWDDHNRLVDVLKLNVVVGTRNFRADNRAAYKGIFN